MRRWIPIAPDASVYEWQGRQSRLHKAPDDQGGPGDPSDCDDARVTMILTRTSVCFVDANGVLRCAGNIGPASFGGAFVNAGITGVDQIIAEGDGGAACVHVTNGTAWCIGTVHPPDHGQLNLGPNGGSAGSTWKQWGTRSDVAEIVTSTFDQICARYTDGTASCTGRIFNATGGYVDSGVPVQVGGPTPPVERIWVSNGAEPPHINETAVFRPSNGSPPCRIDATGLYCPMTNIEYAPLSFGVPGHVVDGGSGGNWYFPMNSACWLDDTGVVTCNEPLDGSTSIASTYGNTLRTYFGQVPHHALALATNYYELSQTAAPPARCAAFDDGSLWCIGENSYGKLGAASTSDVFVETEVAPRGSVRIHCDGN